MASTADRKHGNDGPLACAPSIDEPASNNDNCNNKAGQHHEEHVVFPNRCTLMMAFVRDCLFWHDVHFLFPCVSFATSPCTHQKTMENTKAPKAKYSKPIRLIQTKPPDIIPYPEPIISYGCANADADAASEPIPITMVVFIVHPSNTSQDACLLMLSEGLLRRIPP